MRESAFVKHRNSIDYEVDARYALFSDVATRIGGEKCSYQVPTYQALKGITESIYWKPTIIWVIDAVRIMNKIQTEGKGVRPIKMSGGNELSYYTYLKDVRYQVRAHFEWNEQRKDLIADRNENKHHQIALRSVARGGRRDIFLGTRECQGYVESCEFGSGEGFYDGYGDLSLGYMSYGFSYLDENPQHDFIAQFWSPVMRDGVIEFVRPDSDLLDCHVIREKQAVKKFVVGENLTLAEDE
ncbi:type I-C CRISPR-associated protein Cas5c [Bifidobacterium eulemuris]|uniref:pre-crRNA processing endonuclease n=1 Tax=Bifidobacterium eulemuris TaxID=1765219 RepID=A0A261FYG8_9BIFI|nr:type I-C CRISPR-associated protein Cas5c [Bifidobacterium eulemuris]OZG64003.1 type I-C CRISPR-associated protein Cas5 [Bifidobacterium eulemuris]QOL32836.1 type I-C CRISPR-associated protein Cas5 [Bifidobacterium eulemuris]